MSKMLTTKTTTEKAGDNASFAALPAARRKLRPLHPGFVLRELYLEAASLSQEGLAQRLRTSRRTVNMIVNGQRPVTVDMAHRLARVFGTSARYWLNMQVVFDEAQALQKYGSEYEQLQPLSRRSADRELQAA